MLAGANAACVAPLAPSKMAGTNARFVSPVVVEIPVYFSGSTKPAAGHLPTETGRHVTSAMTSSSPRDTSCLLQEEQQNL